MDTQFALLQLWAEQQQRQQALADSAEREDEGMGQVKAGGCRGGGEEHRTGVSRIHFL